MKQKYYIGIDISKEKVDIAVITNEFQLILEKVVKNNQQKLTSFFKSLIRKLKITSDEFLVCCEETGIYKRPLQLVCVKNDFPIWVETAFKIKKASSSLRGKSDKQDALRIADYACRYSDKQKLYKEPEKETTTLQTLLNARETIIEQIIRFENQINESKNFDKEKHILLKSCFEKPIKTLKKQLSEIENKIDELVKDNEAINENLKLLTSISGIGKQTGLQFIVYTHNFTAFESPNHLACYSGVAPFPNESGSIIKKARVSSLANKKLKKLLHMAAMSCIRAKGELKEYFIRKVKEGKNKMVVLNNIRNKLIKRMFAVIKRRTEYITNNFHQNVCILP